MRNYVALKINVDMLPDFQKQFGAQGLPTSIMVSGNGKEVRRSEGHQPAGQFL